MSYITIVMISAGLAALINCIFQLVNKILDGNKENKIYQRSGRKEYLRKKEEVYIAAIERLLEIKVGFNYTRSDIILGNMKDRIDQSNNEYFNIASRIRIYATDEIYDMYCNLAQYSKYSYSDGRKLIESSKRYYDFSLTILSRIMQDDLGYRELNSVKEMISCPDCGTEHDAYAKCPKCNLSYSDAIRKLEEAYLIMAESDLENDKSQE